MNKRLILDIVVLRRLCIFVPFLKDYSFALLMYKRFNYQICYTWIKYFQNKYYFVFM
jgi:hypothetical protein